MKKSLIMIFVLFSHLIFFQGVLAIPPDNVRQQIENMNRRLEQNMQQSNLHLEQGDYREAELYTDAVLKDLDVLIEALMPLDERISKLLEVEESILNRTSQYLKGKNDKNALSESKSRLDDLVRSQVGNREKTKATAELASRQLDGQKATKQQQPAAKANSEILTDVKKLLDESTIHQTAAVDKLEDRKFNSAKMKEIQAIETLKKALEKLRQDSQKQQNQQANDDSQSKSQQDNQKQSSSQQQQNGNKNEEGTNQQMKSQPTGNDKEMSAEAALKELNRIRKQARDEQERRKRQFGIQATGEQIPVDKDW